MSEPRWLAPEDVVEINRTIVADSGEPFLLRDEGLLDSACHRPVNLYHYEGEEDVWVLAVELLFGIARNHPFEQGNKRCALEAATLFLRVNGYDLDVPDIEFVAELIIEALVDENAIATFEHVAGEYVRPLDDEG